MFTELGRRNEQKSGMGDLYQYQKVKAMCNETALVGGFAPPKISVAPAVNGWAALVLAVCHTANVGVERILRRSRRASRSISDARRLLIWAFLEVTDSRDDDMNLGWLEQTMGLNKRAVKGMLREQPPEELRAVVALFSRLHRAMGQEDVHEVITAGLLGERKERPREWTRGFLARMGLSDD